MVDIALESPLHGTPAHMSTSSVVHLVLSGCCIDFDHFFCVVDVSYVSYHFSSVFARTALKSFAVVVSTIGSTRC